MHALCLQLVMEDSLRRSWEESRVGEDTGQQATKLEIMRSECIIACVIIPLLLNDQTVIGLSHVNELPRSHHPA